MKNQGKDETQVRASKIWRSAGLPEGRDQEHWAQAEEELAVERAELPTEAETAADDKAQKPREARRGTT